MEICKIHKEGVPMDTLEEGELFIFPEGTRLHMIIEGDKAVDLTDGEVFDIDGRPVYHCQGRIEYWEVANDRV